jgi:hypothetical protein
MLLDMFSNYIKNMMMKLKRMKMKSKKKNNAASVKADSFVMLLTEHYNNMNILFDFSSNLTIMRDDRIELKIHSNQWFIGLGLGEILAWSCTSNARHKMIGYLYPKLLHMMEEILQHEKALWLHDIEWLDELYVGKERPVIVSSVYMMTTIVIRLLLPYLDDNAHQNPNTNESEKLYDDTEIQLLNQCNELLTKLLLLQLYYISLILYRFKRSKYDSRCHNDAVITQFLYEPVLSIISLPSWIYYSIQDVFNIISLPILSKRDGVNVFLSDCLAFCSLRPNVFQYGVCWLLKQLHHERKNDFSLHNHDFHYNIHEIEQELESSDDESETSNESPSHDRLQKLFHILEQFMQHV